MKTLEERETEWIARFSVIEDPHERMAALAGFKPMRGFLANCEIDEKFLVQGCASRVWVVGNLENERCIFRCEAASPMIRGLVALLCEIYSGVDPREILQSEPKIWSALGIDRALSPTRLNGLAQVFKTIQKFAADFLAANREVR